MGRRRAGTDHWDDALLAMDVADGHVALLPAGAEVQIEGARIDKGVVAGDGDRCMDRTLLVGLPRDTADQQIADAMIVLPGAVDTRLDLKALTGLKSAVAQLDRGRHALAEGDARKHVEAAAVGILFQATTALAGARHGTR